MKPKTLVILLSVGLFAAGLGLASAGEHESDAVAVDREVIYAVSFEELPTLQDLAAASDRVVVATVVRSAGTHYVGPEDTPVPITRFQMREIKTLKGPSQDTFFVSQFGGPRTLPNGEIVAIVGGGDPMMLPGQQVILFLQTVEEPDAPVPEGLSLYRLTSGPQGRMLIEGALVYTSDAISGTMKHLATRLDGVVLTSVLEEVRVSVA